MYESFYGLQGKPFQLNPDPQFYFGSRGHNRALAYLQYGLYQGEGFIVITGEIGAGKTTLVRSLIEQLDPARFVAAQIVSTQLDAGDLLRSVATAFGIPSRTREKAHLLASIEAFLTSLAASSKRALLIVDEAQNLTLRAIEELRMLSNFQLGTQALLQSFLVGQPQLRRLMRRPEMEQLSQRVIASHHLGPMDRPETEAYVKHRLKLVGWADDPTFDQAAFDAIYAQTGGIPRQINTLANRLLLAGCLAEKHELTGEDVAAVIEEIREELGGGSAAGRGAGGPIAEELNDFYTGDEGETSGAERLSAISGIREIDERLRRVEQSVSAIADTLQELVRELRTAKADM
jgi:putative secretion ATPase (PEP-CTERM system associated)